MLDRRQFIGSGVATLTVASLPLTAVAASVAPGVPLRLGLVYDVRVAAARRVGHSMAQRGHDTFALSGDLTGLWSAMATWWSERPMAVAGLTSEEALFPLQLLAQDRGLRLVHASEHRLPLDEAWPARIGGQLAELAAASLAPLPARLGPSLGRGGPPLHSLTAWLLAPSRR